MSATGSAQISWDGSTPSSVFRWSDSTCSNTTLADYILNQYRYWFIDHIENTIMMQVECYEQKQVRIFLCDIFTPTGGWFTKWCSQMVIDLLRSLGNDVYANPKVNSKYFKFEA